MSHSFVAYIDESGDDGLKKFRQLGQGGATHWLVISACVYKYTHDLEAVRWRDTIKELMPNKKKRDIHFADMKHAEKVATCQKLAELPIHIVNVLSNKTTIQEGIYTVKNQLYWYVTRHVIERISWLCRDLRPHVPEGNGAVKIIFSKRGSMDYREFQSYLDTLKSQESNIHWPIIDIEAIDAQDHSRWAGLQLADCVASAFSAAIEPDRYGNCEMRYAEILKPKVYSRKGNHLSYGAKLLPSHESMNLNEQQIKFIELYSNKK